MNRRKSREIAMKLLFEMTINKEEYKYILERFKENTEIKLQDVDFEYITKIIQGIEENIKIIDGQIENNLRNWKLNRLSKIDMSILRLATYEIMFLDDVPDKVSVNEAIELTKKYSDDNSPAFINGVLGNMIKK
ncbi:transcription antitermination factor NusB [Clostridium sp. MB40-C1]|uniref:transcription antitermination factor NusB n=1 Tax=Clostridium sp. MB40-C1 TaxID=3070996 RepID=UPI0027DFAC8B|nr:transcription antitermination factor NusB [Clostridium sp. MB40-C1]WMJ81860.1 transcription antitermination factor NusB [Clostridium sp. MB40-C1]